MEKYIRDLIRKGENGQIEFKKTISSLHKIAKTISSMANSHGGTLLIGVNDQGLVVGASVDEELYMLEQATVWYIKPAIRLQIEESTDEHENTILVVKIPNSDQKPHACLNADNNWAFFIRSQDKCVQASDLVIKALRALLPDSEEEAQNEITEPPTPNQLMLQDYLGKRKRITLPEYAKLINVSKRRAYRILIELVRDGKLYEHTYEKAVFYTLTI